MRRALALEAAPVLLLSPSDKASPVSQALGGGRKALFAASAGVGPGDLRSKLLRANHLFSDKKLAKGAGAAAAGAGTGDLSAAASEPRHSPRLASPASAIAEAAP